LLSVRWAVPAVALMRRKMIDLPVRAASEGEFRSGNPLFGASRPEGGAIST
jgi:hypothetical protein